MIDDLITALGEALGSLTKKWKRLSTFNQISNAFFIILVSFIIGAAIINNL
jgi:hypothetical protein